MTKQGRLIVAVSGVALLVFGASWSGAQTPRLVKDINTAGDGSDAFLVAEMDGFVYLVASEPDHGSELWRTDGTAEGTTLVRDVWPGPASSLPFWAVRAGDVIFFAPDNPDYGRELWKSDGTRAGTTLVKDIVEGPETSFPQHAVVVGETLFFVARDGIHGEELWRSDGTEAGTTLVKDIFTGDEFESGPFWLTASGGKLFFRANDGEHGEELWVSDGTRAGTRLVKDIDPGERDSSIEELFDWSGELYFAASDGEHGQELWKSDGTEAGTVMVKDIFTGSRWSFPIGFSVVGDGLFFEAEDAEHGAELRRTDGTAEGTVLVTDLRPGEDSGGAFGIVDVNGTAFFFAVDPEREDRFFDPVWELWTSDGTEAGTGKVRDVRPGSLGFVNIEGLELNGELVFSGEDEAHGIELWRSDGTEAGTAPIRDIFPGPPESLPWTLTRLGDRVLFSAEDDSHGRELWSTDGTTAGTAQLRDINFKGTISGGAAGLLELDGILYFVSEDDGSGRELWRSDGTAAGTFMVRDIHPDGDGLTPFVSELVVAGERMFFYGNDGVHGDELWMSDGTASGTRLVKEIVPGDDSARGSSRRLSSLLATEKYVYLTHFDAPCELWRSDGTAAGTLVVREERSCPIPMASLGAMAFFVDGVELWRSDGTEEGTFAIADLSFLGFKGSLSGEFEPLGDVLLFVPGENGPDTELWRTDGTGAGTFMVKDIRPGPLSSNPRFLVEPEGRVYFQADDGVHGAELWQTDGTLAGTSMVADLSSGSASSTPWPLAGVDSSMYFAADGTGRDGKRRNGLWKTLGSGRETRFVSSEVQPFFNPAIGFGGLLYFNARDSSGLGSGEELWRTDGTRNGTFMIADILPGNRVSDPSDYTAVGRNLFFNASSKRYGRELWVLGAGPSTSGEGKLTSVPDLDGLGSDELAALLSRIVVRDAASGERILEASPGPRAGWDAVDIEPLADLNGNGSAELAVLARKRQRMRVFVHDALTGDLLSTARLLRHRDLLDLETIPGSDGAPIRWVVLSRRGLAGRAWLTTHGLAGGHDLDVALPEDFGAVDLEVAPHSKRTGGSTLVVLGQSGPDNRAAVLTIDAESGRLQGDWRLPNNLIPRDLEIVGRRAGGRGYAAILVQKGKNGAGRVLTIDLENGDTLRTTRLGKKYRALDLEPHPVGKGSVGSAVSVLEEHRRNGRVRVSTRNVFSGRKLGRAIFPGILLPVDLAIVRDLDDSGASEAAVLGEAECAGGATATVLRDTGTGSRLGCHPAG